MKSAFLTTLCLLFCVASEASESPLKPLYDNDFNRSAARHLLSRAGFDGRPEEIQALVDLGLDGAIASLFKTGREELVAAFKPSLTAGPDRRMFRDMTQEKRKEMRQDFKKMNRAQVRELRAWWMRRMVLTEEPLVEKMTLFWHGHFATSVREVKNSYHMYLQNETFRKHALGNFRDLVRALIRDPAMLRYLNNNQNRRQKPNENLARELMELFTLGVGNYTEDDVKEAARALTGWSFRENEFFVRKRQHDPGKKRFLGREGPFDGDDIVTIIFEQPAASRFIVRKLFVFFAHEDPSPEVIETLAGTFRRSDFEIRPVLEELFRSEEFYSARARGTQIKSPVQLVVGTLRLLEIDPGPSPAPAFAAGQLGQQIFLPPSVKGWDGGRKWISTSALLNRYNFARRLLGLEKPRGRGKRDRDLGPIPALGDEDAARRLLGETSPKLGAEAQVDRFIERFLIVPPDEAGRRKLIEYYKSAPGEDRMRELLHLIMSTPEYQLG